MYTLDVAACVLLTLLCMYKFNTLLRLFVRGITFTTKLFISFLISLFILFLYKLQFADTSTWELARKYIFSYASARRSAEL